MTSGNKSPCKYQQMLNMAGTEIHESGFSFLTIPILFLLATSLTVLVAWYKFAYAPYQFFKKLGLPHPPVTPFIGNTHELQTLGVIEAYKKWIVNHGKVFGYYVGATPWFCIADADMLKDIMVKQFDKFADRSIGHDALRKIGNDMPPDLFFMEGEQWKQTRNIITPCFTAKKLKLMIPAIERHTVSLIEKMEELSKVEGSCDLWRTYNAYTMETLLATSFGHEVNILKGEGDDFTEAAEGIFAAFGSNKVIWLDTILSQLPFMIYVTRFLGRRIDMSKRIKMLRGLCLQLVQNRKKMKDPMNKDFLQLLMDASTESSITTMNDEEIVSVCIGFILAGYETTSSLLTFTSYLLALNPNIQDKLCQDIEDYFQENSDTPLYEASHDIPYLDWVIQESLRVIPPAVRTRRFCTETCTINGVTIPKNSYVYVAIYPLHYSPEFWDKPEEFRPERFSPEEKEDRHPMCYMPFGWGPRNCLGMRFAQVEAKMALTAMLRKFKFEKTPETEIPLKTKVGISQGPANGVFLKVVKK